MLNLDAERDAQEPWWFTVHDAVEVEAEADRRPAVRVRFVPIGRIALRAARRAAGAQYLSADLPDDDNAPIPPELLELAGDALSESLLMAGITEWEGVGDRDGNPAPVTPDNLRLFLADPIRFERLDNAYVRPFVLRELEKNGLSPLLNGTSAGATQGTATANRSARRAKTDVAGRTRKKAKRAVPISKTSPRAKKG